MTKVYLFLISTLLYLPNATSSTILSEGEIRNIHFDNVQLIDNSPFDEFGYLELFFDAPHNNGDSIKLGFFGNQGDIIPFHSRTIVYDSESFDPEGSFSRFSLLSPVNWQDLEGFIEIEMLVGDATINSAKINVVTNYNLYSGTFQVTPIPLPGALWLFISGISLFIFTQKNLTINSSGRKKHAA